MDQNGVDVTGSGLVEPEVVVVNQK